MHYGIHFDGIDGIHFDGDLFYFHNCRIFAINVFLNNFVTKKSNCTLQLMAWNWSKKGQSLVISKRKVKRQGFFVIYFWKVLLEALYWTCKYVWNNAITQSFENRKCYCSVSWKEKAVGNRLICLFRPMSSRVIKGESIEKWPRLLLYVTVLSGLWENVFSKASRI